MPKFLIKFAWEATAETIDEKDAVSITVKKFNRKEILRIVRQSLTIEDTKVPTASSAENYVVKLI